jgi:hypothetical protein
LLSNITVSANSVLPVPGNPYSSTPLGGDRPNGKLHLKVVHTTGHANAFRKYRTRPYVVKKKFKPIYSKSISIVKVT